MNKADTDIVITKLKGLGWEYVEEPSKADVIIVNTCAVREEAERNALKLIERLSREYPGKRLVVIGCLARIRPATIKSIAPNAVLGDSATCEFIEEVIRGERDVYLFERPCEHLPRYMPEIHGHRYVVPLQVGCLGNCAYCVVKIARAGRGKVRSYDKERIIEAVKDAVSRGAREIYLTGQEVAVYGRDKGYDLVDLLEELLRKVEGKFMVRIGMMEPYEASKIIDRLLDIMKEDWRVYRYFHLPVQSGSDRILRLMNRKYDVALFKDLVRKIRGVFPEATIVTDIIVGFPGETEEDFWASVELIKELRIDRVNLARYSPRPFTEAGYALNQVPEYVKKERSKIASEIFAKVAFERNLEFVGKIMWGIVSEIDFKGENFVVRAYNYKPIAVRNCRIGAFVKVEVTNATHQRLFGRAVECEEVPFEYRVDFRITEALNLLST